VRQIVPVLIIEVNADRALLREAGRRGKRQDN